MLLRNAPDAICFSGGIGERSVSLRKTVCEAVDYIGIQLDEQRNTQESEEEVLELSKPGSKVKALRVLTDEEVQCAEMAQDL